MAVISIKNKTKSGSLLVGNSAFVPSSYESIATTTLSSSASTVTFSSIPSTYTHLQLRVLVRGTASGTSSGWLATFNSDSGSNYYTTHILYGDGTSAGAFSTGASGTKIQVADMVRSSATANTFAVAVTDILDYRNTNKFKTVRTLYGWDTNGAGTIALSSGLWMNAVSEITSMQLSPDSGSFAANSSFALYGIRGN